MVALRAWAEASGFEGEHGGAFAEGHAVAVGGEGAACGGGDDAHGVPGAEEAEGERSFVAAGDGGVDHAGAHHVEGEADGVGAGGACGGDVEGGAGDSSSMEMLLAPAEAMVRMTVRGWTRALLGVELDGFGLFGLAASAGAADDDGDFSGA